MLTLLAFMFGYDGVTTILLDEPDAHLHANLQREIVGFLKQQSLERNIQFIIATHSRELIDGVDTTSIISILKAKPERVSATPKIITALSDVSNLEVTWAKGSAFILYVEGESDERILKSWAMVLEKSEILNKFCIRTMGGGSKKTMREESQSHFEGLRQIVPGVERVMLFDFDAGENAFHPREDNLYLYEWQRKNIENYFLVKDVWHRTMERQKKSFTNSQDMTRAIDDFFESENLTLPKNAEWKTVDANIFKVVDGKKILFENEDSLFQRLKKLDAGLNFSKETIAANMLETEVHNDIVRFFEKLEMVVGTPIQTAR
jgi:nitrate reductase NapAB chaperone NapD